MYGSRAEADTYHANRSNTDWANVADNATKDGALQKASDYIDRTYRSRFPGQKTGGRAQITEWPRKNVLIDDEALPDTEIPTEVEQATYEAALLIVQGINLNPVLQGGTLKRERVKAGPVETETEYQDTTMGVDNTFSIVEDLLGGILVSSGELGYELLRA